MIFPRIITGSVEHRIMLTNHSKHESGYHQLFSIKPLKCSHELLKHSCKNLIYFKKPETTRYRFINATNEF